MAIKKLNIEKERHVCSSYLEGLSAKEISLKYDLSETTIFRILDKHEIKRRSSKKVFSKDEVLDIVKMYETNSLSTIGNKYNVSKTAIKTLLLDNNVRIKNSKEYKNNWEVKQIEQILTDYVKELPTHEICVKYNISPNNLRYYVKNKKLIQRNASQSARKYQLNENYFEEINDPNKAYILGLIYADGCNYNNSIIITLHKNDSYLLSKIQNLIYVNKRPIYFTKDNMSVLRIDCKKIREDLECKWGVIPNKSLKLTFPKNLSPNYYSDFIRGYFDGDGSITMRYNDKNYFLCNFEVLGTFDFLKSMQNVLIKNVGLSQTKIYDTTSNIKVLKYGGRNNLIKIREYMYSNINSDSLYLNRKYKKFANIKDSTYGKN